MFKNPGINLSCYVIDRQYKTKYDMKQRMFSEHLASARNLYRKDLFAHYGCVNAIEFSKEGEWLVSGGDDRRVLVWSLAKMLYGDGGPVVMHTNHSSNIFCLDFTSDKNRVFSGGNDDQALVHDVNTQYLVLRLPHRKPVYGLHVNPQNDNILATAGDDGRILLYDLREAPNNDAVQCLAKQKSGYHSVMFNPRNPRLVVSANSEEGVSLWDCRKPKEHFIQYDSGAGPVSGISACFNSTGTRVLALRRRLPPVLYTTHHENAVCQFYHPQYYNSCTMKTCCFGGQNDEYVLSGSDDFNLYMWNVPKNDAEWATTHLVLRGHRSIVNQVRYNKQNNLIATSGVEKMIKIWSTLPIGHWQGSLLANQTDVGRQVYTHEEYIYLVGSVGERISHDYSDHSIQEDAKMMAFFDSLIQREIEGWHSDDQTESLRLDSDEEDDEDATRDDERRLANLLFIDSRKPPLDADKKEKPNKIAQLIAQKRNSLAKMAHERSFTSIQRSNGLKEKFRRNGNHKSKNSKQKHNGTRKAPGKQPLTDKESKKHKSKSKTPKRKLSLRETCDNANHSIDVPSTSTGITNSRNALYRVIDQDSEEEPPCTENGNVEAPNLVNILPTPINGTHDMFINNLEMTANVESNASTSRAPTNGVSVAHAYTDSDSDYECRYVTPVKKRRTMSASDSGLGTGPGSSARHINTRNRRHQECSQNGSCSSDDGPNYDKFKKRVKKARLNIRREIAADSDSN